MYKNTNTIKKPVFVFLITDGSGWIRPTSLSAVSVVKRNATSFRLPETVANDGKGQRSIRKRLDCLCQTSSCATSCRAVFGGSGGIRPTSLSAVSVVKRNATLFRPPDTVDVQRIPSGKATNKKRHDCLCQAFFLVAQPLTGARNWRKWRDSNPRGLAPKRFSRPPRCDRFDTLPY